MRSILRHFAFIFVGLALIFMPVVNASEDLPRYLDGQVEADNARRDRLPILLMVSLSDCPYCEKLKGEILNPMMLSGDYDAKVLIRELLVDEGEEVVDFGGDAVPAMQLAKRYGPVLAPTLLFLDPQGREIAQKIRGITTLDFYSFYLDQAIEEARARLSQSGNAAGN